jgi:Family of unknown function (DUF6169)
MLNLANAYSFKRERDGLYTFTTLSFKHYEVYFVPSTTFDQASFGDVNYLFTDFGFGYQDLQELDAIEPPEIVSTTLICILQDFISRYPEKVLVYVCDTSDRKHKARSLLFSRWFEKYHQQVGNFLKMDYEFQDNSYLNIIHNYNVSKKL